jgi:hypothetical protein
MVLRGGKRRDYFPYFTLVLCLALAVLCVAFGAPTQPEADSVFVVSGP